MPDGRHDQPATGVSRPQLTDRQLAESRGTLERGLMRAPPAAETFETVYDRASRQVRGATSSKLAELKEAVGVLEVREPNGDVPNRRIIVFDRTTLRRLIVLGGFISTYENSTANLLELADLMDRSLSRELHQRFRKDFFQLLDLLVGIGDELIARTRKPYQLFLAAQPNPPIDSRLLGIEPLSNYHWWKTLQDSRAGRHYVAAPIPIDETRFDVDDDSWQLTLDEVERNLEARRAEARIAAARQGDAPTINGHLRNLRELRFTDIERQSRARFPWAWKEDPVHEHVELIVYHSVYSILLDPRGNPFRKPGIAPYSILIPDPGDDLQRNFHSAGLYLSIGPLGDYQFDVKGKTVKNLLFGGITGLVRTESSFRFEHYLQERLQEYIKNQGFHAVAAIVVSEGFGTPDLTLRGIKRALPGLIDEIIRYSLDELLKRARAALENLEEVIINAGKQAIQEFIEDRIRDWCITWLIKKIGKKIIPGINVVSAVAEVFDDEQHEMLRALVACVIMVTKSQRRDDMTLSAKIAAGIAIDKVQEEVMARLISYGGRLATRRGKKDPRTPQPEEPMADKPDDSTGTPPDAAALSPPASTHKPQDPAGKPAQAPMTQQQVVELMRAAQQAQLQPSKPDAKQDAKPVAKPDAKPEADRPATQSRDRPPDPPRQRPMQQGQQPVGVRRATDDAGTSDRTGVPADASLKRAPHHQQLQQQQTRKPPESDSATGDKGSDSKAVDSRATADRHQDAAATRDKATDERATGASERPPVREPPVPPTDMSTAERWRFYDRNRDQYPEHIRHKLDNNRRTVQEQNRIDREIRDWHAEQLSHAWGVPVKETTRIPMTNREKAPLPRKNASNQAQWDFFDEHYIRYPPHIQRMIDDSARTPDGANRVKDAIHEHRAQQPMQDTSGGDWEKTNISERTGERPMLQATSTTRSGAEVQIDDFDPTRRVAREYKASLDIRGKPEDVASREIKERMERQAEFAEDRNLRAYEWVAHSTDDYEKMTSALSELKAAAQKHPDPTVREKLKQRYAKITVLHEPVLDRRK